MLLKRYFTCRPLLVVDDLVDYGGRVVLELKDKKKRNLLSDFQHHIYTCLISY